MALVFVLIVGCGRVGSSVAKSMLSEGHEVSVLDENPEAIALLNRGQEQSWEDLGGSFTVGTALEIDALLAAGIENADAFVASTDGDNTNLVIAQIAQRRFEIGKVVVRVLDPGRAKWYAEQGLQTVCPTQTAIDLLERAVRGEPERRGSDGLMYVLIVGAGKVGWNLARELIDKQNEVTVVEASRRRYEVVEEELEHNIQYGDGTELWILERAGIERADLVIAVTGDDEDNILICQVAKEKYGVERVVARCNNPRNLQHFELLGVKPAVSATDLIMRLIEHEVPKYGLVHLLDLKEERLEIIEMEVAEGSPADGSEVQELGLPAGRAGHLDPARRRRLRAHRRLGHQGRGRGPAGAGHRPRGVGDRALRRQHRRCRIGRYRYPGWFPMGDRLTARRLVLVQVIGVRIPVPQ